MSKKVLIVAAHPDDELLGCGGAILHHLHQGDKVRVSIVSEGLTSRESKNKSNQDTVGLKNITKSICKKIGIKEIDF